MEQCIVFQARNSQKKSQENSTPLRVVVGLIFARNKICRNYSINQGIDGFISFQAMNIAPMYSAFKLRACLCMKFGMLKQLLGYNFERIKSYKKEAPLRTLVGLIFARNKICSNYSINQGFDEFVSFQAMNIAPIFYLFQLVACLCMKFGNVEAIDRLQIRKKIHPTICEKAAQLRALVGLIFQRKKNRSEHSINEGVYGFPTCQWWTLHQSFDFFNFVFFCIWSTTLLALSLGYNYSTKKSQKAAPLRPLEFLTLRKNVLGTTKSDILTLLRNFCGNSQTAEVTSTSRVL